MLYSPTVCSRAVADCASRRKSVPIYEYYCADCKIDFDKLVKLSDANAKQDCPECGGRHTQKKLSTFATSGGSTGTGCGGQQLRQAAGASLEQAEPISRVLIQRIKP